MAVSLIRGSKACVTGANGFIALHLVDQLLQSGVSVTAAVRSSDPQKLKALRGMEDKGDLKIVSGCELLEPGSFEGAMQDAQVCFHTASPFWMDDRITDPIQQLVRPAQDGTINVLDACVKARSVQRVVVTSSFASVMNVGGYKPWAADFEYCEDHWNESSEPVNDRFPEPVNGHAYRWSKTVAERAAWEFDSRGQFDVSCVLPPMVLGENKQQLRNLDDLNQSSLILYKMLCGDMKHVMPGSVGFVDVHDVAKAHVLAAQTPAAGGQRYLCSGETRTWLHVASTLHDLFPQFSDSIPNACEDGTTEQPCMMLQNRKIRAELGMEFIPLVTTLRAQGEGLIKAGLL
jgi:nucleoside-diphosphate-sugar epimerase